MPGVEARFLLDRARALEAAARHAELGLVPRQHDAALVGLRRLGVEDYYAHGISSSEVDMNMVDPGPHI